MLRYRGGNELFEIYLLRCLFLSATMSTAVHNSLSSRGDSRSSAGVYPAKTEEPDHEPESPHPLIEEQVSLKDSEPLSSGSIAPGVHSPSARSLVSMRAYNRPGRPRRSRRRMVYGLTIDKHAMRTFSLAHDAPRLPPADLSADALEEWWVSRTPALWIHVTTYCTAEFELPAVNGLTFVWVGDERVPVVPLVDSWEIEGAWRTAEVPSDGEVEVVARYMCQEGQRARWYQVTFA